MALSGTPFLEILDIHSLPGSILSREKEKIRRLSAAWRDRIHDSMAIIATMIKTVAPVSPRASLRIAGIGSAVLPLTILTRFGEASRYPMTEIMAEIAPNTILRIIAIGIFLLGFFTSSATLPQASKPKNINRPISAADIKAVE
ncbi:hypothetical protein D3C81_1702690 [compost metagenome]